MDIQLREGALHPQPPEAQQQFPVQEPLGGENVLLSHRHHEPQPHGGSLQGLNAHVLRGRAQHIGMEG